MRVVLDSNVIVSALSTEGLCNRIFEYCIVKKHTIVISKHIIKEVRSTLRDKFKVNDIAISSTIKFLQEWCELDGHNKLSKRICRDADDDEIIALAKDNNVQYIITGDKDLLVLKKIDGISIISPRELFTLMKY